MPAELADSDSHKELSRGLERLIAGRTWGRLHDLRVEIDGERVSVRGRAPSYYVKQLAIQACLQATETMPLPRLDVDIAVGAPAPAAGFVTARLSSA
jgi:hypothetical protein